MPNRAHHGVVMRLFGAHVFMCVCVLACGLFKEAALGLLTLGLLVSSSFQLLLSEIWMNPHAFDCKCTCIFTK